LKTSARTSYDGYRFGSKEIYCPWDVTCYTADLLIPREGGPAALDPPAYWNNTSDNRIITQYMPNLSSDDAQKLQDLVDGKNIKVAIDEGMNYGNFHLDDPAQFWNILVYTGCLTLAKRGTRNMHEFRIPNAEVAQCFEDNIKAYYDDKQSPYGAATAKMISALLSGDAETANAELDTLLRGFVSVRDGATRAPKENFYQGFINGLFAAAGKNLVFDYRSNRESGDGCADALFKSKNRHIGVVLELKAVSGSESLEKAADLATEQIEQKDYAAALKNPATHKLYGYGIAFRGRECVVSFKDLSAQK